MSVIPSITDRLAVPASLEHSYHTKSNHDDIQPLSWRHNSNNSIKSVNSGSRGCCNCNHYSNSTWSNRPASYHHYSSAAIAITASPPPYLSTGSFGESEGPPVTTSSPSPLSSSWIAQEFGYRTVSPFDALRYTSTDSQNKRKTKKKRALTETILGGMGPSFSSGSSYFRSMDYWREDDEGDEEEPPVSSGWQRTTGCMTTEHVAYGTDPTTITPLTESSTNPTRTTNNMLSMAARAKATVNTLGVLFETATINNNDDTTVASPIEAPTTPTTTTVQATASEGWTGEEYARGGYSLHLDVADEIENVYSNTDNDDDDEFEQGYDVDY